MPLALRGDNGLIVCGVKIAGEHARRVDRVLDVRQGELCWVAGTVYMDMPLKPNILEDLTKEVSDCKMEQNVSIETRLTLSWIELHVGPGPPPHIHQPRGP